MSYQRYLSVWADAQVTDKERHTGSLGGRTYTKSPGGQEGWSMLEAGTVQHVFLTSEKQRCQREGKEGQK